MYLLRGRSLLRGSGLGSSSLGFGLLDDGRRRGLLSLATLGKLHRAGSTYVLVSDSHKTGVSLFI